MASIAVIKVVWTGFPGAPGLNTFYADPATANPPVVELRAFYQNIRAQLPSNVTVQVPASGDTIEDTTGEIDGDWSVTPAPAAVVGSGTGVYSAPVGAHVNWLTAGIVNGRRLRGKTFLVPLIGSAFQSDGSLGVTALGLLQAEAATLAAATNPLRVWHRPTTPGGSDGSSSPVTGSSVPDFSSVLRSRRD